ncbi:MULTISPECIES: G5 domain-containing protein [Aerococcus]|uniref:G5 domain-containing protein n=1 Tax=Aerococcus mictus TaxID=2976810 RepID=A0A1E9PGR6_9LACT|nr:MULTISPECIES: G5 domain-containing protein [Aerococcus]MBU5610964.1 G5 domain-containing protein [Aerococcus urinae]MCY3034040.1 G5 domain-containing protein [Aerococcus mictus]MCY3065808.1 G5 domain-containing protein [Aerococcus mictus]MCY3066436.1 G5 domain-containing protein [Aerococcus mictus]MCY3071361.1 G5 domain-containing protein [Aerococcus mictus]
MIDKTEETIKVTESEQTNSQTAPSGVIEEQLASEGASTEYQTDSSTVTETPQLTVKPTPEPQVPETPSQSEEGNEVSEEEPESVPLTPLTPAAPVEEVQPTIVKRTDHSVRTTPIHFGVQKVADPNLEKGAEKVVQEGKDGLKTETIERIYENDQLISETVIATDIVEATP